MSLCQFALITRWILYGMQRFKSQKYDVSLGANERQGKRTNESGVRPCKAAVNSL